MTRNEIIELAIEQLGVEDNSPYADAHDSVHVEDFVNDVIASLAQQLPDGEIQTCADFKDLGIACCDASHHSYCPHVDMKVVTLTDGSKAWLCCNLRTALLGPDSANESFGVVDLEEILGGRIRGTPTPADSDGQRTPSRKK